MLGRNVRSLFARRGGVCRQTPTLLASRNSLSMVASQNNTAIQHQPRKWFSTGVSQAKMSGVHTAEYEYTTDFNYIGETNDPIPSFRIMNENGEIVNEKDFPDLDQALVEKMYTHMVKIQVMDQILYDLQRQGSISFYMTAFGEYATHIGSAAALLPSDMVYAQYREQGVLMWRGFSIEQMCNQCFSNEEDLGKGRQMPVHYGSRELNYQTISSPLSTQIPQATGAAYAQKLMGLGNVTICYFGEGAASEGDFHAALNFASTLDCPTLFFCRNNRYAISTPVRDQYRGDGMAARGAGYGMRTIRCDGNDIFAVYETVRRAREYAAAENRPVLIEAMTYRVGHHSTSDDYTRYRSQQEVDQWTSANCPVQRLRKFMEHRSWWSEDQDTAVRKEVRKEVLAAFKAAQGRKKPPIGDLFTDVYDTVPPHLQQQHQELLDHLAKYPNDYPVDDYAKSK